MTGPGGIGCPFKSIVCKIYKCAPDNMAPTPGEVVTQQGGFRNDYVAGEPYAYGQEDSWQERMKRGVEA